MKIKKSTFDKLTKLATAYLNQKGQEVNNPKPLNLAPGIGRPPTLQEQIQRIMRKEVSQQASAQGFETFEESQDFDIEDSFDSDQYETVYTTMTEESPEPPPADPVLDPPPSPVKPEVQPEPSEDSIGSPPSGEPVEPEPEP